MGAVGIVAEYNPLHNGHIYHLEQAKKETGADFCVIAMSGNFVQRGEPACADKFTRAEWALRAGADLIVEIPQCLAVASAERFAEGAVKLLAETGVVTDIAFGVETDNLDGLYRIADILDREPPAFRTNLAYHLKQGKSYPRAQFDALSDLNIPRGDVALLTQPNNILAVEYIKAIRRFAPHIRAVPILRQGNGYNDAELTGPLSSATAIRQALREGNEAVLDTMPLFVSGAMRFDEQFPITLGNFGPMILYRTSDIQTFLEQIKSKRYTMARCKRIAVSALLHIRADLAEELLGHRENLYLRVLGFLTGSRGLLAAMASAGSAPVILRNADIMDCTEIARDSMAIDAFSTDLMGYVLGREPHRDQQSAIRL